MTEVIVFPDAEELYGDWLRQELVARGMGMPVGTRVPNPRPAEFVRLIRTGGPVGDLFVLDRPQITVEAWALRESRAVQIIQLVRGLFNSLPRRSDLGFAVYAVEEFSGPANLPDPDTAQTRYTYTFSSSLRGTAV